MTKTAADLDRHAQDTQHKSAKGEPIRCFICERSIAATLESRPDGPWWVYECKCAKYGTCAPANKAMFV